MAYRGHKTRFKPKNPQKYKGDPSNIIARSSWETRFLMFLDSHPDVIEYSSEETIVPYRSPIDGKLHRYFPDMVFKKKTADGKIETIMVEIKPANQTKEPVIRKKLTKGYINEVKTWGTNSAKWKAAEEYCKDRNWQFIIMTEKNLGIKF